MQTQEFSRIRVVKKRQLLYQAVQEELKSFILRNALKPGEPLPTEAALAQQLNVSRTSVREAVKSLEALGILEARAGAGLFVKDFSFDSILENLPYGIMFALKQLADVLEIRFHIENGMIQRVIENVTPEQITQIHQVLDHMQAEAVKSNYSAEADREFHQVLYQNVDNELLQKILDIFWMVFRRAQEQATLPDPRDPMDTYKRHAAILDALERRDVASMQVAMRQHYEGIEVRVKQLQSNQSAQTGQVPPRSKRVTP